MPSSTGRPRGWWAGVVLGVALCCILLATPAAGGSSHGPGAAHATADVDAALSNESDSVEVVVRLEDADLDPDVSADEAASALERHANESQAEIRSFADETDGVTVAGSFWLTNAVLLEIDAERVDPDRVDRLDAVTDSHLNVDAAEPTAASADDDFVAPDDAGPTAHLEAIGATAVWDEFDVRGDGASVAVLDTGVDADHPELELSGSDAAGATPEGWAEFDSSGDRVTDTDPQDRGDHGTHVSGTVAGDDGSGTGVGVAPEADLFHGAVLTDCDPSCTGTYAQVIGGLEWAVEQEVDVVTMSLSTEGYEDAFVDPVRNAVEAGTVVVTSAGNDGQGSSGSPGNVHEALTVGSTTGAGEVADYSGGETIETADAWTDPPGDWPATYAKPNVVAPGEDVLSTVPGGGYERKSGTSMATPHVAGAAALLRSANADLEPAEIAATLESTARDRDERDDRAGHGLVDVHAAVGETAAVTVDGTVTDAVGEPIRDATVTVDDRWRTTTDADGTYELSIEGGARTLEVDAPDRHRVTESIETDPGDAVEYDATLGFAELNDGVAPELEAESSTSATIDVRALEELSVAFDDESTVDAEEFYVSVDGSWPARLDDSLRFDDPITDDALTVTIHAAADVDAATDLEVVLDLARDDGGERERLRIGETEVVPRTAVVGVVGERTAGFDDDLDEALPVGTGVDHVETGEAVAAAESGDYDALAVLELPRDGSTDAFVDAASDTGTGVAYLGDGAGDDDPIYRLLQADSVIEGLEIEPRDGPHAIELEDDHPAFDGVDAARDAPVILEDASFATAVEVPAASPLATTEEGGTALSLDRTTDRAVLAVNPLDEALTDDGLSIVTGTIEYVAGVGVGADDPTDRGGSSPELPTDPEPPDVSTAVDRGQAGFADSVPGFSVLGAAVAASVGLGMHRRFGRSDVTADR